MNQIKPNKSRIRIFVLVFFSIVPFLLSAQEKRVTIQEKSIPLENVFAQIEKQTGYSIAYDRAKINIKKKISVSLEIADLDKAFSEVLKNTGLTYKINGYHIILVPIEKKEPEDDKKPLTQTIRGTVTEATTGLPLGYANVTLLNQPSIGAVTDSLGEFRLKDVPVGRYDIQVSSVGYEPYVYREILVTSAKEVYLDIPMKENARVLDEVVVRPRINKEETLNSMAITGGRMISVEEANRYAGGLDDPARLVTSFAGVAASPSTNAIAVHGNSPQFLQWKLEGVEIPNPTHFSDMVGLGGGLFSGLSSQVMGNSDFFNGAFPAEYNNALSGAFDLSIRNGNNEKHEHTAQIGLLGLDFASEGPISRKNRSTYIFNYRYSTTGLMGAFTDNTGITYQDLSFKLNFPTKKAGTFSVWGIGLLDANKTKPLSDTAKWETYADRERLGTTMSKGALGITHKYNLENNAYFKTSLAATYSDDRPKVDQIVSGTADTYRTMVDMENTNLNIVLNSYFNKKYGSRHTNRSGITVTGLFYSLDYNLSPNFGMDLPMEKIAKGSGDAVAVSAYSNSIIDITDKLTADVGLTGNYFTLNNDWSLEPRLALKWKFLPKQSLAIAYGLHSRREKLDYYYVNTPQTGGEEINKELKQSKAHHFVLTYDWSISNDLHLKVEPYYQSLFDIPVEPGTSFSIINYDLYYMDRKLVNDGKGRNYGIDLTLEHYLSHGYYYMFTGSVFKSEYQGGDDTWRSTRFDRGYIVNALGGKEWIWGDKRQHIFNANLRLTYQGGDYYIPIDEKASLESKDIIYDETQAFSKQFSPMFSADFGVSYKLNKQKVAHEFGLQILNFTGYTGQHGYFYNEKTKIIEKQDVSSMLPNVYYKIHF